MPRYVHADPNLYTHIKSLRAISLILSICLIAALVGWHRASQVQRISIPPNLNYGGQIVLNSINPWEVYNFAGYVWQQVNRCSQDCFSDYPKNLDRLTAFLTPAFKVWLKLDSNNRSGELLGRTRFLLPLANSNFYESVTQDESGAWIVQLDVQLEENIDGVPVKQAKLRYHLKVVAKRVDPEFNPWGLMLDTMPRMPERIVTSSS